MSGRPAIVLDANILLRSILGRRVRQLLDEYAERVAFFAPDACFTEARRYTKEIVEKRRISVEKAFATLDEIGKIVTSVEAGVYSEFEEASRERVKLRDPDDWPLVALALLLNCPVWTEDQDLFGSGIATWTTSTVEIYLRGTPEQPNGHSP